MGMLPDHVQKSTYHLRHGKWISLWKTTIKVLSICVHIGTHLLLLWSWCVCCPTTCRSAHITSGTDNGSASERPQLKYFQYVFTALSCRQEPIRLFTQLRKDEAYAVPKKFLKNFTFSQAGTIKWHTSWINWTNLMSLYESFLLLNMFRMLLLSSSGADDCMWVYCSVMIDVYTLASCLLVSVYLWVYWFVACYYNVPWMLFYCSMQGLSRTSFSVYWCIGGVQLV